MILALVVALIASPAWATVNITVTDLGDGVAEISYNATSETQLVRAFALDITVSDGSIVAVSDFKTGVSVAGADGYGIFPANFSRWITVNAQGDVDDWGVAEYTPVADAADPGAVGGLGGAAITIEMGSLYDGDANKPAKSGVLCKLTVDTSCTMSVTTNAMRGNIVLENAAEATPDLTAATDVPIVLDCFPAALTQQYADFLAYKAVGLNANCWCAPPNGTGYQCDGDADGKDSGIPFRYRVFTGDLALIVANWRKNINDPALDPCADIDHKDSGIPFRYRVFTGDLSVIVANWRKNDSALAGDCPR